VADQHDPAFDALVARGVEAAAALGHAMKPRSDAAVYGCERCGAVFYVGFDTGGTLRLIAAAATRATCNPPPTALKPV
jgi:hypothetical protein